MEEKLKKMTEESITRILDEGISTNNLDHLYKLTKINCMAKKGEENMYGEYNNYGEYGARGGRGGSYGEYREGYGAGSYGRRGRRRYRGDDSIERMNEEYGRYRESRSYGDNQETDKSFHYMIKALEDFIKVLHEEAETPQQHQMLNETLQRSMK